MDTPALAAGVGLAVGLSGAALLVVLMEGQRRSATNQQPALESMEVRRDDNGRILGIESVNSQTQFVPPAPPQ